LASSRYPSRAADVALADDTFILATGAGPRIYAIDFRAALKRHNNNTPNAIVSRSKVHPESPRRHAGRRPREHRVERGCRTAYVITIMDP